MVMEGRVRISIRSKSEINFVGISAAKACLERIFPEI